MRRVLPLLLAGGLAAGCGLQHPGDLNFRIDDRLEFLSPASRETVQQPMTVTWSMRDFTLAPPGSGPASDDTGYFAVFVDRAPVKPGKTLAEVAKDDEPNCAVDAECLAAYLKSARVYTTTQTSIDLPRIPNDPNALEDTELHSITVILMDTEGRRIGESAWELQVRTTRGRS